ncbi:MAG: zinc ABC transporter substrate-binding protein [Cyanobacteriota bacterium]|nr:zinc ABC transporter substrate-binding protein [Cyanobacteriota bacterium]
MKTSPQNAGLPKNTGRQSAILPNRKISGIGIPLALIGCLLTGGLGCALAEQEDPSLARVVSTSTLIADWTETIAGEAIHHTGLLEAGTDPHIYEPTPADSRALEEADLILYNGYNLEPGLIRLMEGAGVKAEKLAVGEVVPPLQTSYNGQQVPDPHVWGDVAHVMLMVGAIRDALVEVSPANQTQFQQRTRDYLAQLSALDRWIEQQIQTIPPQYRILVTTHDAFQYYAHAYGLELGGSLIGISTEEQPSAQTVTRLVDSIQEAGTAAIFAETTINPMLIQTVAAEAQVTLAPDPLYSDSLGGQGSGAESYIAMMEANTRTIVQALGGSYQPFSGGVNP